MSSFPFSVIILSSPPLGTLPSLPEREFSHVCVLLLCSCWCASTLLQCSPVRIQILHEFFECMHMLLQLHIFQLVMDAAAPLPTSGAGSAWCWCLSSRRSWHADLVELKPKPRSAQHLSSLRSPSREAPTPLHAVTQRRRRRRRRRCRYRSACKSRRAEAEAQVWAPLELLNIVVCYAPKPLHIVVRPKAAANRRASASGRATQQREKGRWEEGKEEDDRWA